MEGGDIMRFESINEVALKWNISTRRIRTLCIENRIKGATKIGAQWLIPCDAKKPKDLRVRYKYVGENGGVQTSECFLSLIPNHSPYL